MGPLTHASEVKPAITRHIAESEAKSRARPPAYVCASSASLQCARWRGGQLVEAAAKALLLARLPGGRMMDFGRRLWVIVACHSVPPLPIRLRDSPTRLFCRDASELSLNYSQAGSLITANALGYLGALSSRALRFPIGHSTALLRWNGGHCLALVGSGLAPELIAEFACAGGRMSARWFSSAAVSSPAISFRSSRPPSSAIATSAGPEPGSCYGCGHTLASRGRRRPRAARRRLAMGGISALFAVWGIGKRTGSRNFRAAAKKPMASERFHAALGSYFCGHRLYRLYDVVVAWMVSHGASALDAALTWGTLGIATISPSVACAALAVVRRQDVRRHSRILDVGAAIPLIRPHCLR